MHMILSVRISPGTQKDILNFNIFTAEDLGFSLWHRELMDGIFCRRVRKNLG